MKSPTILFEDNHLLVLNKPAGLLTQPAEGKEESLEAWGKAWIKESKQKKGDVFLHAIHRLDKPASGIVLFARTSKALSRLSKQMREGICKKTYLACIDQPLKKVEGTLEHYLVHDDYRAEVFDAPNGKAKWSRLDYKVIGQEGAISLLQIALITGRYHQIRAQLSHLGCPIIGDFKYGSTRNLALDTIALHHYRLEILHPISNLPCTFECPLPDYWPF